MDLEDDTTVLTTLKSFNSFISRTEPQQRLTERPGSGTLQGQYKRSMELLEAADRLNSTNRYLQLDQEKKQMELSHKRARFELEKAASDRTRALEHEVDRNQELLAQIKKLKERESEMERNLTEKGDANRALWKNLEALNKKLEDRDGRLSSANQTVSTLKDEVRELKQKIQNQDCTICAQTLENQELQEQLDLQRRKYQDVSQLYQSLQATQSTCSDHVIKIKALERRLALQEQDVAIMKTVKSELARVPGMEKELKNLREDNSFLRESRENCSLLKEEVEGLRKKLERMEKMKEDLVNMELEKNRMAEKLQAWENLGQSTGLNIRKPEDLSREVIQIQQREFALKEQNYTLNSRVRSAERSHSDVCAELSEQRGKTLEEKKKRELQDTLVRRLQKRLMLLNKERDGMRAILESYDSELGSTEYSPQLSKRLKEAEDVLQRTQNHNVELEAELNKTHKEMGDSEAAAANSKDFSNVSSWVELELESVKKQHAANADSSCSATKEELSILRNVMDTHSSEVFSGPGGPFVSFIKVWIYCVSEGDYDPLKTRVLHLKMNPTSVAKQQRQQEMETIQEEVTRLRELVRSLQDGGSLVQSQDDSIVPNLGLGLPPSKEVLDLRKQMESSELKNQRLKEVFQRKIQEFRTVCYILTGYQMDITTENQYRLTSVYAEHMDDSLLFKKVGTGVYTRVSS
ncbi:hypothetical protein fugu_007579 [Takifugu bimaculatus]|uniref:Mitotic arrest deficient 1 like 1 n=1 Tax=Takifugu bimaculatus TaxID=433685 RepID=A0A4Z2B184_9TELE|nr:hypothetical protein fugu_007579 [Takifugu bimaculatus]